VKEKPPEKLNVFQLAFDIRPASLKQRKRRNVQGRCPNFLPDFSDVPFYLS
jgi:hypothetical protein